MLTVGGTLNNWDKLVCFAPCRILIMIAICESSTIYPLFLCGSQVLNVVIPYSVWVKKTNTEQIHSKCQQRLFILWKLRSLIYTNPYSKHFMNALYNPSYGLICGVVWCCRAVYVQVKKAYQQPAALTKLVAYSRMLSESLCQILEIIYYPLFYCRYVI